jgi:hypothetical protein
MNGIRDQQVTGRGSRSNEITITVISKGAQIDCSRIPTEYDTVWLVLSLVDAAEHEKVIGTVQGEKGVISKDHVSLVDTPLRFRIPHDTGQVYMHLSLIADSMHQSVFRLILGEWGSPAFIPCLKQFQRLETLRAIIPDLGYVDLELILS